MIKISPNNLNFENISKKRIRVPWPEKIFLHVKVLRVTIFFASLLVSTARICSSQDIFSSNITPDNYIVFPSKLLSAIFKAGNFKERQSFADFYKKECIWSSCY